MTQPGAEGVLDKMLDRTVVPGYTNLGYHLRRLRWRRDDPRPGAMVGRRALVTGAASGLGLATARGLVRLGATVHVLGRSPERIEPVAEELRAAATAEGWPGAVRAEVCDVSDLTEVRWFADELNRRLRNRGEALDVLVHNAGVLPAERTTSPDGHELAFATHVLGPVLMTEQLLPALSASTAGARVVLVSSGGMYGQKAPVQDLEYADGRYRGTTAYARSKRVQVDLTPTLADRWSAAGVSVAAMHPGWADTPGVASSLPLFRTVTRPLLRDAEAGADTVVWLAATEPAPPTGLFWHDRVPRPTSYVARTRSEPAEVAELWRSVRAALPEL
ncbi:SDR family NAD(P)-dependent oxidoreductase [Nocardioides panacisoli]|uniref:Oxidoreductase n=1 Tax=Nocardioides panacisoli TaxID=627624 RepID=A0ABP7I7E0_9ACTN